MSKYWKIPPETNAEFVARMEDVLDVYHRPYDDRFPVICMDESSKQLIGEVRDPLPMKPGSPQRQDNEYVRNGVAEIFMAVEPLAGKRVTKVTPTRTSVDWAVFMREIADIWYPQAQKIVLVMDNLNTHDTSSFYKAFPPEEAHRLSKRFEIHHTPKHGSWLNMAEIELSVLKRQCLNCRIDNIAKMQSEVRIWTTHRNNNPGKIRWQFTTSDARVKLIHLYPEAK